MAKIFKLIWFVSLFAGLFALLWTYASVPLDVSVTEDMVIGREYFFYIGLLFLTASNFSLYALSKNNYVGRYEYLRSWKYTFGTIINGFIIVSMLFINMYNSTEKYNYDNFGYLVLVFLGLIVLWLIALPFFIVFKGNPDENN